MSQVQYHTDSNHLYILYGHGDHPYADGSFSSLNIKPDHPLLSKDLFMLLLESKDPSRHYYIQGTIPRYGHVPFLWFLMDTVYIFPEEFCKKVAAFGCWDGQVIILDLTQLNFQLEIVTM